MKRVLRYLLRKFYLLLAVFIISLAVLVQLGRTFSYMVADYQPQLADYLSGQLGAEVSLGSIHAEWEGLQPVLDVTDVRITHDDGEQLLALDSARIRLDLQASMFRRQLVWGNLTFSGAHLAFQQLEDGRWRLAGTRENSSERVADGAHHRLLDILLAAKRIAFEQTRFSLLFYEGQTIELDSPALLLENTDNFHRLKLQLGIAERADTLFFIAESEGDPRRSASSTQAYLQLRDVPTDFPMAAVSALLAGSVEGLPIEVQGGNLDASLWLSRRSNSRHYQIVGDLAIGAFALTDYSGGVGAMDGVNAAVSGRFRNPGDWQIGLQDGQLWVNEARLDHWNMTLSSAADDALQIHFDSLPLTPFAEVVLHSKALRPYPKLSELLEDINPRGVIDNLWLRLPFAAPADWSIAANLHEVSVSSWGQVPAIAGVSGYLYSTAEGGYVQLDSQNDFSLSFDDVYNHPLNFDSAKGQVAWSLRPDDNRIYVNSGRLQVTEAREHAEGYFWLALPWGNNPGDVDLTIYLGASQVSANQHKKYVPAILPDYLTEWIAESLGNQNSGVAESGGFLFRGTINSSDAGMSSFQLALDVVNGELNYYPGWPGLKNISGHLLIDDENVEGRLDRGQLYNSDVYNGSIRVNDNPHGEGKLLSITGEVDGIASDGLRILRQSVLRQYVGNNMDSWYLHGSLKGEVALAVPLAEDQPGQWQQLAFDVDATSFALDNFNLELKNLNGRIRYNTDEGIESDTLRAELFAEPVDIVFDTRDSAGVRSTTVDVSTTVSSQHIREWTAQPALDYVDGLIPLDVHIALAHQVVDEQDADARIAAVSVAATLDQARINLPPPMGKIAGQPRQLIINYILGVETALADIHYGDALRALLHIDPEQMTLNSAVIGNSGDMQLPLEPVIAVVGHLPTLDLAAWQRVYGQYTSTELANESEQAPGMPSLPPLRIDLTLDEHATGPLIWTNARIQARQQPNAWDVIFTSDQADGELLWPLEQTLPAQLRLQRLSIPSDLLAADDAESEPSQPAAEPPALQFDESFRKQLRTTEVNIDLLELGQEDYGRWEFTLRPYREQLAFTDIIGVVRGLTVGGVDSAGAYLLWYNDAQAPYTGVSASVSADNLEAVMDAWGWPRAIEGETAEFTLNLFWGGSPAEFSLGIISGSVNAVLDEGRFLRTGDSAGQGLLRLLGLFNFDSLARRLRLDFSDLYKSGLTFDRITGEVTFDQGMLHITEPVVMQSPSSQMQISGQVDVLNETLDTRLVATLPVTGNLTVITALAAGLPAAAGVFLISKIFEREMRKMASVSYTISGDWDEPLMRFDRLFDADPE